MKKAEELRKKWRNKHCSHPHTVKELGTSDYICVQCGESGSKGDFNKAKP